MSFKKVRILFICLAGSFLGMPTAAVAGTDSGFYILVLVLVKPGLRLQIVILMKVIQHIKYLVGIISVLFRLLILLLKQLMLILVVPVLITSASIRAV